MMTEKEKYLLVLNAKAALSGKLGSSFKQSLDFDVNNSLSNIIKSYDNNYLTELLSENPSDELYNSVSEYERLLNALPKKSYESIKISNDNITKKYKELQSENLYDPKNFFDIYFSLNTSSQEYFEGMPKQFGNDTINFNSWFSNSKVVDKKGMPLEVYHGAGGDEFTRFNFDRFPIAYFAEKLDYSEWFKKVKGGKGSLFRCYLRIQNPIDLRLFGVEKIKYDEFVGYIQLKYGYKLPLNKMLKAASDKQNGAWAWQYLRGGVEWLKEIKNSGYFDGFMFFENNPDQKIKGKENVTPAWAVFYPEQIKSINNLTFSYESKDIRFNEGGKILSE
tara:strand:+ start:489 stop:1490 length:1002 start_codon:yes stop_codon:yes gene_type:complete